METSGRLLLKCAWLCLAALAWAGATSVAQAASVAMITDLQGKVVASGGTRAPVALLAELESGVQVELDAKALLVALYLDGSGEYLFRGPALVAFHAGQPEVIKGPAAEKRNVLGGKGGKEMRIRPVGVAQAGVVMRSPGPRARIRLLNPSGTRTLEARPEFRWQEEQTASAYRFQLSDDTGRTMYETEVSGTSLKLPASVALQESIVYTWSVSRQSDGRRYSSMGDFSIAPGGVRQEVETLRPAGDAPFSDRVAYAAWLEQLALRDEARKYWKALAAERPDSRLTVLARD